MMRYHLLIDADDTLWENNIYFEQAIHGFITFLDHSRLTREEVRTVLDEVERLMGYGTANFTRSLVETYRRLAEKDLRDEDVQQVRRFGESIRTHPLQFLDGVKETLDYLSPRHDLVLLTKGDLEEQKLKVERSGIEQCFRQVVIVQEKNVATHLDGGQFSPLRYQSCSGRWTQSSLYSSPSYLALRTRGGPRCWRGARADAVNLCRAAQPFLKAH